jgi:formylglycine-generating enzyme required for sulfatase activity
LGTTEVTQAQWAAVMGSNPSSAKACGATCPVEQVSWADVQQFIDRLSARGDGYVYRLPTEAEWEYACRAGTTTRYYSGDDAFGLNSMPAKVRKATRVEAEVDAEAYAFTAPVGKLGPNPFGLYDMHGTARQWCADRYDAKYYAESPANDPPGPPSGSMRVIRGSFSESSPGDIRSAHRAWAFSWSRHYGTGFRVARTN